MELSANKANERLTSASNLANRFGGKTSVVKTEVLNRTGKKAGSFNFPPFLKTSIAIQARIGAEPQKDIAKSFGTVQTNVSAIKTGKTEVDEETVEKVLGTVRDAALEKVMQSIGLITTDKLEETKAKDLSVIAANMSKVAANTIVDKGDKGTQVTLHVYCPEPKQESSYRTIEV
jgi:hypothetical protein